MSADCTLVLERRPGGLRLYLGGDLQFDTDDEAAYHERLAHLALLAARSRFPGPLDLLVLGGGDGLLARELLRHEAVASIRIVDYNPAVIALARSELRPYNEGSLDDPRVTVEVADARECLATAGSFHAIFADLTFPGTADDCALFTRDWFTTLRLHLEPGGLIALNGVSPEKTPAAYWCVYQTLRAAGLATLPGRFQLSSFAELGYGEWGFFLASNRAISPPEILSRAIPPGLRTLDGAGLASCFDAPRLRAELRKTIRPACDGGRTLYEYLLESAPACEEEDEVLSFLGYEDTDPPLEPLASLVPCPRLRDWLDRQPGSGIDDLLMCVPLSHRIVTRELMKEWSSHLFQVARTLNLRRLVSAMLRRAALLPERLVAELRRFRGLLARGEEPSANLSTWGWRFFSVLMLVLVLSQTAMPSSAYAKGFSGGFGGGSHGSSFGGGYRNHRSYHSSSYNRGGRAMTEEEGEQARRIFGGLLLGGGAIVTALSAKQRKPPGERS